MNAKWEANFSLTHVSKIPRLRSYHNPLLLSSDQEQGKFIKDFCFETSWIKHHDFLPKISEIWSKPVSHQNPIGVWSIKIKRVQKIPKSMGEESQGSHQKIQKHPRR